MGLTFIIVVNDEGLLMAEAGDAPDEDFAPYSPAVMEKAMEMARHGNFGTPICNALVLSGGRMLIMHEAEIGRQMIYLALLCRKVPMGIQKLLQRIVDCVSRAMGDEA